MDRVFIPYGPYIELLNGIAKWKIIDAKSIYQNIATNLGESSVRKKLKRLEDNGLISSKRLLGNKKHLYLTSEGMRYSSSTFNYCQESETISHDIILSEIATQMNSIPQIDDIQIIQDADDEGLEPDAIIYVNDLIIALELELTQKSNKRMKRKYSRIGRSNYNYCLYLSPKEKLLGTYLRFLESMNKVVKSKLVFSHIHLDQISKLSEANFIVTTNNHQLTFKELICA